MAEMVILADQLQVFLQRLAAQNVLVAPVKDGQTVVYRGVKDGADVCLDFDLSTLPAKTWFLPQTEELYWYSREDGRVKLTTPLGIGETVLFGLRPCDVQGILRLDPVFEGRFGDRYWSDKREKTTIVGVSCRRVLPGCFCSAHGFGPTSGEGADLMLIDLGERFVVQVLTDKGERLVAAHPDLFTPPDPADQARLQERLGELGREAGCIVDLSGVREAAGRSFASPYWERLARKCIGCGVCTYVCPTCHCFDIVDLPGSGQTGKKLRCWDSCMFKDFTLHTSGHNPRPGKKERVRNRFLHKLSYHYDRYGIDGCVGCGRCIAACPANIDITRVIRDIMEGI